MSEAKYVIEDWAGNVCFDGRTFATFDDAWGFLYTQYPDDDESLEEYEVTTAE